MFRNEKDLILIAYNGIISEKLAQNRHSKIKHEIQEV